MADHKGNILWVDDEVDLLKPHILFLQQRGYNVATVSNGEDALDWVRQAPTDLILLDESMPGMGGLETLSKIKEFRPALPVIMVTKNEEETLMEEAIGEQISDYLTKPVNPSQILLVVKKFLEGKQIVRQKTAQDYIQEFNSITMALMNDLSLDEWVNIYRKLVEGEVELDSHPELGLHQTVADQRKECNKEFSRFVENHYRDWVAGNDVTLSPHVVDKFVVPELES
ncbi:MAG: response regulator, partial [Ectothiorhodospiraceae bacterium]|nr:response regulator [Ectothiorhodospiraceae bacterium]